MSEAGRFTNTLKYQSRSTPMPYHFIAHMMRDSPKSSTSSIKKRCLSLYLEPEVPVSAPGRLNRLALLFTHTVRPTTCRCRPRIVKLIQRPAAKMKHLAAYLLLGLGGNTSPSAKDIKGVLSSVGIDADDERLSKLLDELKGKDIPAVRRLHFPHLSFTRLTTGTVDCRRLDQAGVHPLGWWRWSCRCPVWRRRCCCRRW